MGYDILDLSVHLNHLGGSIALVLESILVFLEQLLALESDQIIPALILGLNAMPNWHPFLVHFPVALLPIFFY